MSIQKKRKELEQLVVKIEMLRVNLQIAKKEYMVKVGSLFLKDSRMDLEIIRYKNILHLMNKGLAFDEAIKELRKTYYSQQIEIEKEQEKLRRDEEIYKKRRENNSKPNNDVKKLWKKLISRFHPDLVQDSDEKKKRDRIMKQINRAYQEGDFERLVAIDNDNLSYKENSIDNLEEILLSLINEIVQQNQIHISLKTSEWYGWMEKINKAKKKSVNIFAEMEKKLLDDITTKIDFLNKLKSQIKEKEHAPIHTN